MENGAIGTVGAAVSGADADGEGAPDFVQVIQAENGKRARSGKGRDDIHRRGAFQPDQYEFFGWYYLGLGGRTGVLNCSGKVRDFLASEEAQDFKALAFGDFGKCGVCGARFACGEIWQHTDRRDLVHVGCDCAAKYNLVSGTDWNAVQDERDRALKAQRTAARRSKARERILAAYPGLAQALATDHHISRDLARRFEAEGTLSVGRIALAFKLEEESKARAAKRAAEPVEVKIPAPTGRTTVRGIVISLKTHEGQWGTTRKMTVKVTTPTGVWLAWSTVPVDLDGKVNRGDEVEFDATLEAGRDPYFAFAKRPTRASVVRAAVPVGA
jgi:hypothetical protein